MNEHGADDRGLREIEAALDRLGAAARAGAPAGLEERVFGASVPSLVAARAGVAGDAVVGRIGPAAAGRGLGLRLAAAVGLAGAGLAVWMASLGPNVGGPAVVAREGADESDLLMAIDLPGDERLDEISARIDLLYADAAAFDGAMDGSGVMEWPGMDLSPEEESL